MMSRMILVIVFAAQLGAVAVAQDTKSITEAETVIAIYTNDLGLEEFKGPQLIVSVWGDGSIVWSNDQLNGGPPYFAAQLNPDDVTATLKKLDDLGAFDMPELNQAKFGPDAQYTTLLVRTEGKELKMASWHELSESKGTLIAGNGGLKGLDGKKLLPALAIQGPGYLHYRMTWLEIRLAATNLIPKSGKEIAGASKMNQGKLSWQSDVNQVKQ